MQQIGFMEISVLHLGRGAHNLRYWASKKKLTEMIFKLSYLFYSILTITLFVCLLSVWRPFVLLSIVFRLKRKAWWLEKGTSSVLLYKDTLLVNNMEIRISYYKHRNNWNGVSKAWCLVIFGVIQGLCGAFSPLFYCCCCGTCVLCLECEVCQNSCPVSRTIKLFRP